MALRQEVLDEAGIQFNKTCQNNCQTIAQTLLKMITETKNSTSCRTDRAELSFQLVQKT